MDDLLKRLLEWTPPLIGWVEEYVDEAAKAYFTAIAKAADRLERSAEPANVVADAALYLSRPDRIELQAALGVFFDAHPPDSGEDSLDRGNFILTAFEQDVRELVACTIVELRLERRTN